MWDNKAYSLIDQPQFTTIPSNGCSLKKRHFEIFTYFLIFFFFLPQFVFVFLAQQKGRIVIREYRATMEEEILHNPSPGIT